MSTIDSKEIIVTLLEANGHYDDDPQAHTIWSYMSVRAGRKTYAVYWHDHGSQDLNASEFVKNPILLFSKHTGLTEEGKKEIQKIKSELGG